MIKYIPGVSTGDQLIFQSYKEPGDTEKLFVTNKSSRDSMSRTLRVREILSIIFPCSLHSARYFLHFFYKTLQQNRTKLRLRPLEVCTSLSY